MKQKVWTKLRVWYSCVVCFLIYCFYLPTSFAISNSVADAIKKGRGVTPPVVSAPSESGAAILLKLIVALAIIGVAAYLTIRFLAQRTRSQSTISSKTLLVHGLATGRAIHVVKVGEAVLFLGVGENVTLLDAIREPESVERFLTSLKDNQVDTPPKTSLWKRKSDEVGNNFDDQLMAQIDRLRSEQSGGASTSSDGASGGETKWPDRQ